MKTIYLILLLTVFISCTKEQDITINDASSARVINPNNSLTANPIVVDSIIQLNAGSNQWIQFINSARYQSLDTDLTGGIVDWSYPVLLKTYKINNTPIRYKEISYRLFESIVYHNDEPLYRQLIVHAIFNADSINKDYAIIIEHFNCLFDIFDYYAYWKPNTEFYGSHTYMTITGDTLDQYTMWNDTLKLETYTNHSIDYYNNSISWNNLVTYVDNYHYQIAPIKRIVSGFPPRYSTKSNHWYPIINHIYNPLIKDQLIDVEGAIILHLIN